MLRWKTRITPLLIVALLIVAALLNAKGHTGYNWDW